MKYLEEFRSDESAARQEKLGIWTYR